MCRCTWGVGHAMGIGIYDSADTGFCSQSLTASAFRG